MSTQTVEVVVRGPLGPLLLAALEDFVVQSEPDGRTTIVGTMADQPQLVGLLEMLGGHDVEIISVNPRPDVMP